MGRQPGISDRTLGAKLAPKLARAMAAGASVHLRETSGVRAQIAADGLVKFFDTVRQERDTHGSAILENILGHPDTPPEVEKLLHFAAHGRGEFSSYLGGMALGRGIASPISGAIANALAPSVQFYIAKDPHSLLGPEQAAAAVNAQLAPDEWGQSEAAKGGYDSYRFDLLRELERTWPGAPELLELLRRGHITLEQLREALVRQGIHPEYVNLYPELIQILHSPEALALMVLKGIKPEAEAAAEAEKSGTDPERFADLVLVTGEPLGLEQMLEAYRRGYIDDKRLEHGVRQSRVRDEWIDVVKDLRFERASPADAINAAVQGHLNHDQAKKIAEDGGLFPDDFDWLLATYGQPIAPIESIELWRRGEATQGQVEEAIREGHIKDKYIPRLLKLKRAIPSMFQIVQGMEKGGLPPKVGARLLTELGLDPEVVQAEVHKATAGPVTKAKGETAAEIQELYHDRAINAEQAKAMLKHLGIEGANADYVLALVDLKRDRALQQAAMSPIRSAYISRRISRAEASAALDHLGIETEQRDHALIFWTVDREATHKTLSEAQIVKANILGLLTDTGAETRLERLGYTLEDARLLLDSEKGRTVPAP